MPKVKISVERVRELLAYDQDTGTLRWKVTRGKGIAGQEAGSLRPDGYRVIGIVDADYLAHVVVWALETGKWPNDEIDHIDTVRSNNRIGNLRPSSRLSNCYNQSKHRGIASGLKGAYIDRLHGGWLSQIQAAGVLHYLGRFGTKEEAHAAYCAASVHLHGEFGRIT